MGIDPALIQPREQQRMVSQVEYTGKRKDTPSQILSHGKSKTII
jgi:hypothetical protein